MFAFHRVDITKWSSTNYNLWNEMDSPSDHEYDKDQVT